MINASKMQIWIDGITGTGKDGSVIDDTANPAITTYTGAGFIIQRGSNQADYELRFTSNNITISAIRVEGNGVLVIVPYCDPSNPDETINNTIDINAEGYSIFTQNSDSTVSVETMEGTGNGSLQLKSGVQIQGYFGVLDRTVYIGTAASPSRSGIRAKNVVVDYGHLIMQCSDILFEGISETNKIDVDVLNTSSLQAETTKSSGTALVNAGSFAVMCGGQINVTSEHCPLGTVTKKVRYYDLVNFETTQQVEEMKDVRTISINNSEDHVSEEDAKRFSYAETERQLTLQSLSKPLYTLSFNMLDENGNIIEETRVEHGTVRIKTAYGIGRGGDGRGSNDFKIEQDTPVTISLLPDYGYQFTSGSLNNVAMTVAQADVATYQFNMPANHLHLRAIFTPKDDSVIVNNSDIVSASISNLAGQIHGNAEFKVESVDNVDREAFQRVVEGMTIASFLNLSLNQVVMKGSEEAAWRTGITDLNEPSQVSLQVSDNIAACLSGSEKVGVLREHNGQISRLDASYDPKTKKLSFVTDGLSTFAIVYKATPNPTPTPTLTPTPTPTLTPTPTPTLTPTPTPTITPTGGSNTTSPSPNPTPNTGDSTGIYIWLIALLISGVTILNVSKIYNRKRNR